MARLSNREEYRTEEPRSGRVVKIRLLPAWIGVGFLLVGLVVYLSLIPPDSLPSVDIPFQDKAAHFATYGVMMLWFGQALRHWQGAALTAVGLILLGVALEFLQARTPYRSFEIADMASNAVGVAAGFVLSRTRLGNLLFALEDALNRFMSKGTNPRP